MARAPELRGYSKEPRPPLEPIYILVNGSQLNQKQM